MPESVKLFTLSAVTELRQAFARQSGDALTLVYTPPAGGAQPFAMLTFEDGNGALVEAHTRGKGHSWTIDRAPLENALNRLSSAIIEASGDASQLVLEGDGERFVFGAPSAPVAAPTTSPRQPQTTPAAASPAPVAVPPVYVPAVADDDPTSAALRDCILGTLQRGQLTAFEDLGIPRFTVALPQGEVTFVIELTSTWVRTRDNAGVNRSQEYPMLSYPDYTRIRFAVQDRWNNQQKAIS